MDAKWLEQNAAADGEIVFRLNQDFEIITLPPELIAELGYESTEDLLYYGGMSLLRALDTEDIPAFQRFVEQVQEKGAADPCFARLRTRDGRSLWYVFTNCAARREDAPDFASCCCRSLSDDVFLQEYLRKEEARLRQLSARLAHVERLGDRGESIRKAEKPPFSETGNAWTFAAREDFPAGCMERFIDDLPCGLLICEYHTDSGLVSVRFFNDTFCGLAGCTTGELRAFRGRQILTELLVEGENGALEGDILRMCTTGRGFKRELRLKRTEAAQWVQVTGSASRRDQDTIFLRFALLDISKEKRTEEKISFQNYCLERLNDSLFFGIIVKELGLHEKPLYMSANIERYLERLIPDIKSAGSLSYRELIHPQDYPAVEEMARNCERERLCSYELEFRLRMEDGSYRWIKMHGKRLDDLGSDHAYLLTFFDISSVKEAQEQLRIREEEYRTAVLHSDNIIVRLNMEDNAIYVPPEVARQYHMPDKIENMPQALIDKGCIQQESIPDYLTFYAKIRRGENCTVEIRSRWFGDRIYWFRGVATVIAGEKGAPQSAIISFTDITAQKQMVTDLKTLEESEKMLGLIIGSSPKMILKYQFDTNTFLPISPPAKEIFSHIPGRHDPESLLHAGYIARETLQDARNFFDGIRNGTAQSSVNIKVRARDGRWLWYNCLHITSFSQTQKARYCLLFCEDITNRRKQELASIRLRDYTRDGNREILFNLEYNLTLDSFEGSEGIIPACYQNEFMDSYTKSMGRILEDVLPQYKDAFCLMFEKENLLSALERGEHSGAQELQIRYEEEPLWVRVFYQILKDPYTDFTNIWISCIDIHSEKLAELHLMEMAKLDPVTGIYNRAALEDYVTERCGLPEGGLNRALIMLDVDGFGKVNDLLGHACGDQLLRDIAQTLQMSVGDNDMVARIGGDEFAIYVSDFSDIIRARERLRIIIAAAYREVAPGFSVSISAGVAIYPRDGKRFEDLYRKADLALYRAKIAGRNKYMIYDETMSEMPLYSMVSPVDGAVPKDTGLYIRTFGYFEVFLDGEALLIHNAKAKELLALLVDRRGAFVSQGDIISCLWENDPVNKVTLARLRKTAMLLRNALKEYGIEDLIESRKGLRRLNTKKVECDLYHYLSHKPEYQHLYRGTYMANYSWGELTIDELERERFHVLST